MARPDPIFGGSPDLKEIVELELARIRPDPDQPRKGLDQERLAELAASIREHGLLQPVSVRRNPDGEGYLIVTGERRYQAHRLLGRERIEAIVLRDIDDAKAFEVALIENLQREDLTPFEEAAGYSRLKEEFGYTDEQVAERVGKARATITNTLALNRLPERIRSEAAAADRFSKSVLLEIARLGSEAEQLRLWERIKKAPPTLRGARQEKQGRKVAPVEAVEQKKRLAELLRRGTDFARRLEKTDPAYLAANPSDYERLRAIYERLGNFLAAATPRDESGPASEENAA